ncbi:MAG: hypothetical protein JJU28_09775 [Cyclobacteriaceae bacterium]|nr:hypothetical protein [Cyclobacteriaceae bacterium]
MSLNPGLDSKEIAKMKEKILATGNNYLINTEDQEEADLPLEEFARFYFIGIWEGKEVIYDAALYTLRLHHQSEVYEMAQQKAFKKFPEYKRLAEAAGNEEPDLPEDLEEDVNWYITEMMSEIEEEESIKVAEHVEIDTNIDFGISINACLNLPGIEHENIETFIKAFNSDTLKLDETYYSFQEDEDE